jgi:hypothetical protein
MLTVLPEGFRVNQNIVDIGGAKQVKEGPKSIVDVMLEGAWPIREPERHNEVFKLPISSSKGR